MADIPAIQPIITGWNILILCFIDTVISAAKVATKVTIIQGTKISVGLAAGGVTDARMAIILTGMRVRPLARKIKNISWALDALSLWGFNSCRLSIAFKPKGVAALSNPSILAEKFIIMCPIAGWFLGTSGNSLLKKGPTILERKVMAPAFSPILINPRNSAISPTSLRDISKPS